MIIPSFEKRLIDSNILIYASDKSSQFHKVSRETLKDAIQTKFKGVISLQNILEFYSVITSAKLIPHPLPSDTASKEIKNLTNSGLTIIYPDQNTLDIVQKLVNESKTTGRRIYDLYLIATMLTNEVYTIITANDNDFKPFRKYIKILNPIQDNFTITG